MHVLTTCEQTLVMNDYITIWTQQEDFQTPYVMGGYNGIQFLYIGVTTMKLSSILIFL